MTITRTHFHLGELEATVEGKLESNVSIEMNVNTYMQARPPPKNVILDHQLSDSGIRLRCEKRGHHIEA